MIVTNLALLSCILSHKGLFATPIMALRESNNCQGCHNPGRSQLPVLWRRCTLDCAGCHVDPNGSGPRNQWGYYYSQDQLAAIDFVKPIDPLKDQSYFDAHIDSRMVWRKTEAGTRSFPMNSAFSLRLRPLVNWLHVTMQKNFMGRVDDVLKAQGERRVMTQYSLMLDALPMNLYLRYFQGTPVYGVRRPNHSLWIRERIGLDQFAQTRGYAFGGTPNVPFFHVSMVEGDPDAPEEDKQQGYTAHGGMRGVTLGWHINGSLWKTESLKNTVDMSAVSVGANVLGLVLLSERNWRTVTPKTISLADLGRFQSTSPRTHPSSMITEHTVTFAFLRGLWLGYVLEELVDPDGLRKRNSVFLDLHPIPNLQLEFWHRRETGLSQLTDTLAVFHLYADI